MTTMLYIDDIEMNIFTLQAVIENANKEYKLLSALSAEEGLSILLKNKDIKLIFLDVMMPEIDGYECAKMIRSNKKTKDIPIIFVTAKTDDASIRRCYEVGGNDYISKPFNPVELLARTESHLQLQQDKQAIIEKQEFIQHILDIQKNYICVMQNEEIIYANKSFYNFLNLKKLSDFTQEYPKLYKLLCDNTKEEITFKKENNKYYFYLHRNRTKKNSIIVFEDITMQKLTEHEANFDFLTQIYNRNKLNKILTRKLHKKKEEALFTFIVFDIDHFKQVNDTFGHQVGDIVLSSLAKLVSEHIRPHDIFARWGGEEFVLLINNDIEAVAKIAKKLRKTIEQHSFTPAANITCSFGLTQYKKDDTIDTITARADKALYEAKESGRNRVCVG